MSETQSPPNQPAWKLWLREAGEVWCGGWSRLWPRLWIVLAACGVGMVLVLTVGETDVLLQQKARVDDNPDVEALGRILSKHSDLNFAVPLSFALWVIGAALKKVRLRKLGLACLMATLLAGLIVLVFRLGTGRPRPYAAEPNTAVADGFHGPHWDNDYRSFPSGHATTSSATAASLAGAIPVLTIPGVIYSASVSWSRMQLDKHHPIDVAVGTVVGATCGLCFASAVPGAGIRLRQRKRKCANAHNRLR
jgi:membrane-associated phospholipid phosphatase